MIDDLKLLVIGTIKSLVKQDGLKIDITTLEDMSESINWKLIDSKKQIINYQTKYCFEYKSITNIKQTMFIQIEMTLELNTVIAINVITNPNQKITKYE